MSAFTPGNIVVYRVGAGGTTANSSAAAAVFLDEYTPGGTLMQSIPLPTTDAGANHALTASGSASSEGLITDSQNSQYLLLTGYDAPVGTAGVTGTTATADPRIVGRVDSQGNIDTGTVLTGFSSGNNIRSAASVDGTNIYAGGATGAAYTMDDTSAAPNTLDATNTRQIEVVNNGGTNQLYYSTGSGTAGIYTLGMGTPTSGAQTGTLLPGTNTQGTSPYGFAFAQLSPIATANDTLYVADSSKGIEKFSLVNGTWTSNGTITTPTTGDTGLAISVTGGSVTIYATNPSNIFSYTDMTGYNGAIPAGAAATSIVTAPTNEAFRGLAFAPQIAAVCYVSGTLIRTAQGDVAVEALRIGDLAETVSGAQCPIRWLGHRTINCRRHPRPTDVMPIRIAACAFGENRPARDLFVSPGHSICVDAIGEVLIPASSLVNGTTICQIEVDTIEYWHVELDSHNIILAENLPAESYLEMGNRSFFAENGLIALAASPDTPVRSHADFCRPFVAAGPVLDAVRARLGRIAISRARADQAQAA